MHNSFCRYGSVGLLGTGQVVAFDCWPSAGAPLCNVYSFGESPANIAINYVFSKTRSVEIHFCCKEYESPYSVSYFRAVSSETDGFCSVKMLILMHSMQRTTESTKLTKVTAKYAVLFMRLHAYWRKRHIVFSLCRLSVCPSV